MYPKAKHGSLLSQQELPCVHPQWVLEGLFHHAVPVNRVLTHRDRCPHRSSSGLPQPTFLPGTQCQKWPSVGRSTKAGWRGRDFARRGHRQSRVKATCSLLL